MNATRTWRLCRFRLRPGIPFDGLAQEEAAGKPAPSNVRGKEFPRFFRIVVSCSA